MSPANKRKLRSKDSPDIGGLLCELRCYKGEVLSHLDPEVGFGDAAVVRVDGMDTSHFPSNHPVKRKKKNKDIIVTKLKWLHRYLYYASLQSPNNPKD